MQNRNRIKILVVVVLSVLLALAKYFNAGLTFIADNSYKLTTALSHLTNLSKCLNCAKYQLYIKDLSIIALLLLLISWRLFFLRKHSQT